jgi:hypothetical protein
MELGICRSAGYVCVLMRSRTSRDCVTCTYFLLQSEVTILYQENYMIFKGYLRINNVMAGRLTVEQPCVGDLHPGPVRIELNRQGCATAQFVCSIRELIGQDATCSCWTLPVMCSNQRRDDSLTCWAHGRIVALSSRGPAGHLDSNA